MQALGFVKLGLYWCNKKQKNQRKCAGCKAETAQKSKWEEVHGLERDYPNLLIQYD